MADRKFDSGGNIKKRTPLEQAIAEKTDRRAKYEAKRKRDGLIKTTVWVRSDRVEEVKAFIRSVNEANPQGPVS